jgi:ribonuclease BN (tRNA processing enzyme)
VKFTVIGCSPAWPNPGGAHSGYLLECPSGRLLVVCWPGVLARLRERDGWPHLDAIAITHFHLDHWGDLVPWVWGAMYRAGGVAIDDRPELWVHAGGHAVLEQFGERFGFRDMFDRVFTVREYAAERPFTTAGFDVTPLRLPHYTLETYGFRLSAGGSTIAYSGDSGPSERLVELAQGSDLFVCEATLDHGDDDGQPRGHLSVEEAISASEAAAVKHLLLTHRPAELSVPAGIERAYDGLELEVPSGAEVARRSLR